MFRKIVMSVLILSVVFGQVGRAEAVTVIRCQKWFKVGEVQVSTCGYTVGGIALMSTAAFQAIDPASVAVVAAFSVAGVIYYGVQGNVTGDLGYYDTPQDAANYLEGTRHAESQKILKAVVKDGQVVTKGDGCSSGSVELWVGVTPTGDNTANAEVGGLSLFCKFGAYFAFAMPLVGQPTQGYIRLGTTRWYYDQNYVKATASWYLTESIGHAKKGEGEFLSAKDARIRFEQIKVERNLTIQVAGIRVGQ